MSGRLTKSVVAALLASGVLATSAVAAPPQKCFVKVNGAKTSAGKGALLARRLAGASSGDTIHIGGHCVGNYTITKDLSLVGDLTPGDTFLRTVAGTAVTIAPGATVLITDLFVSGGTAATGGGIFNEGDLTLGGGAVVLGSIDGGGVFNGGTLTMTDDATIAVNFSFGSGAGLYNRGHATIGGSASIHANTSAAAPLTATLGGGIFNEGSIVLRDFAVVRENFATNGGGIFNDGELTLEGNASVTDNTASAGDGGAISEGGDSIVTVDPAWAGSTCEPANSPNDYDASNGGAACP